MFDFFVEGGWGMWPILVFGMVTVGAGVQFARRPEPGKLRFIAAMGLTTLVATIHATWIALGAVFGYLEDPARVPDAELARVLIMGLKESTRPGSFGGLLLVLACLLSAVGVLRAGRAPAGGGRALHNEPHEPHEPRDAHP
ncbi:hypothetical protein [Sorangium sp. So ce1389]|uniref:hypothetical protein n=1 Tax=Sorangium sp. So ce1389 TaxID=3133336 RepID=UPI003F6310D3